MTKRGRKGKIIPMPERESELEQLLKASLIDRGVLQEAILDAIEGAVIVEFPKK